MITRIGFALVAVIAVLFVSTSQAGTIAATNFDGATKSAASQTMSDIVWTGDDLVAVTPDTEITTVANANAGYFTTGFGANGFAPDQNIENEGPWNATIEITLNGAATGTVTGIDFDYAGLTNSGSSQGNNFRAQNFDILVNGVAFDTQRQTGPGVNGAMSFADTATLNNGLNTIQIISSSNTTPGYNMGIDNLVISGDLVAIPEPSALALVGLGLIAAGSILRRR